jgi:hypothetical protein
MSLRDSIFDNLNERNLYKHLKSIWGKIFNIYPQLPFTKIFDIDTLNVNERERNFLLKTNIDYTICDKKDRPLMCIEFDEMGGYNQEGKYIPNPKVIPLEGRELRKKKLELKLRIAKEHQFPFFVVSFEETKKLIPEKIHLTILDGIIGKAIGRKRFREGINNFLKDLEDEINSIKDEEQRHEFIQDAITTYEAMVDLDPIANKAFEIMAILAKRKRKIKSSGGIIFKPFTEPELPEIKDEFDIEGLEKRLEARKNVEWVGCEVVCETPKGVIREKVKVRNFEDEFIVPYGIAFDIAMLLVYYKLAELEGIKIK